MHPGPWACGLQTLGVCICTHQANHLCTCYNYNMTYICVELSINFNNACVMYDVFRVDTHKNMYVYETEFGKTDDLHTLVKINLK